MTILYDDHIGVDEQPRSTTTMRQRTATTISTHLPYHHQNDGNDMKIRDLFLLLRLSDFEREALMIGRDLSWGRGEANSGQEGLLSCCCLFRFFFYFFIHILLIIIKTTSTYVRDRNKNYDNIEVDEQPPRCHHGRRMATTTTTRRCISMHPPPQNDGDDHHPNHHDHHYCASGLGISTDDVLEKVTQFYVNPYMYFLKLNSHLTVLVAFVIL